MLNSQIAVIINAWYIPFGIINSSSLLSKAGDLISETILNEFEYTLLFQESFDTNLNQVCVNNAKFVVSFNLESLKTIQDIKLSLVQSTTSTLLSEVIFRYTPSPIICSLLKFGIKPKKLDMKVDQQLYL